MDDGCGRIVFFYYNKSNLLQSTGYIMENILMCEKLRREEALFLRNLGLDLSDTDVY